MAEFMSRVLISILAISICAAATFGQGQNSAVVGEKHYGTVCTKLTTDPECKVCGLDDSHHWRCYSHSLWKDIPGDAMPLPEALPSTKPSKASNEPDTSSCWSSKFDEITDPNIKTNLLRDRPFTVQLFKKQIQQAGGTDEFLLQFEKQKTAFEDSQAQGQDTVEWFGAPHPIDQMILLAEGGIEIASCIAGLGPSSGGATSIPLASNPDLASTKPDNSMNSDCKALTVYRDTQLVRDFDLAMTKYNIFKEGMLKQEDYARETLNLMNDQWWAGQTGAEIAIEVKYYTDLFNDLVGWVNPLESESVRLAQGAAVTVDLVKTEEDEGARKAAGDAATELTKELAKQGGSFLGLGLDTIQHQENQEGMAAYKAEVQRHVRNIESEVSSYRNKMTQSQARVRAISDLVASIDKACNPGSTISPNRN
jgi:hypothetical protein